MKALRRQTKHGPARLAGDLQWLHSVTLAPATVHRILVKRGLHRLRDPDPPTGEQRREVIRYEHDQVGDPVNVHIKKARTHPTLVDGRRSRPPAPGTRPAQGRFGKPQLPI